jgi:hypothetical protein
MCKESVRGDSIEPWISSNKLRTNGFVIAVSPSFFPLEGEGR